MVTLAKPAKFQNAGQMTVSLDDERLRRAKRVSRDSHSGGSVVAKKAQMSSGPFLLVFQSVCYCQSGAYTFTYVHFNVQQFNLMSRARTYKSRKGELLSILLPASI